MSRPTAYATVPKCWKELIDVEFPDDLHGVRDAKHNCKGLADPEPYYDDNRVIDGRTGDGIDWTLELNSGQSNYYGHFIAFDKDGTIIEDQILEDLNGVTLPSGQERLEFDTVDLIIEFSN